MTRLTFTRHLLASAALTALMTLPGNADEQSIRPETLAPYTERPITDDIMYFVMPDRFANGDPSNDTGGIPGSAEDHGFDPSHKGFYHGGDFKGLTAKLDYLADMGVSAIWMTPIFKNKPVQGNPVNMTAGYHGYWITDFTQIDPHLGSNDDLKTLVTEAHKRNMKVIFDIITNHTADVIKYEECFPRGRDPRNVPLCDYRSKETFPYTTRGGPNGAAINHGFAGDDPAHQTAENFAKLTDQTFAYTPYVPSAEQGIKVPAWLNDVRFYHNRGDSEWQGESSLYGDFAGLDDLFTEHPAVLEGMTEIYKHWISEYKIDGYRIDTAKHVGDSFWQAFAPAIKAHAAAEGIPHFYMFGEVYDPEPKNLSHFTAVAKLPAVLDFGFQSAASKVFAEGKAPKVLAELFAQDWLYQSDWSSADTLPTFLGNHDMGRIGHFIANKDGEMDSDELLRRSQLAHALMYTTRGVPVVYYGDEQGFIGDGGDQDAREDMFESHVASYADNKLIGSDGNSADDNFDKSHPLYQTLQQLAALRRAQAALRGGSQTVLFADNKPGIFAVEREDEASGERLLMIFNTASHSAGARFKSASPFTGLCPVGGMEASVEQSNATLDVTLPPLGWTALRLASCNS